MNERIREFEKLSGLDVYGLGRNRLKWQHCVEKFSELIVAECAGFLRDELDDHFAAEQLEEHFGVE